MGAGRPQRRGDEVVRLALGPVRHQLLAHGQLDGRAPLAEAEDHQPVGDAARRDRSSVGERLEPVAPAQVVDRAPGRQAPGSATVPRRAVTASASASTAAAGSAAVVGIDQRVAGTRARSIGTSAPIDRGLARTAGRPTSSQPILR